MTETEKWKTRARELRDRLPLKWFSVKETNMIEAVLIAAYAEGFADAKDAGLQGDFIELTNEVRRARSNPHG